METTALSLKERWETLKSENPKTRIRDAAKLMNSSEVELLATQIGQSVTVLKGNFKELLKEVPKLGYVMALTRNDDIVHERKGVYEKVSFNGDTGLVLGDDIDLRLFMSHWKFGFAVQENDRQSLQFFDKSGEAIHKIYLTDKSSQSEYDTIVRTYGATSQSTEVATESFPPTPDEKPDHEINETGFKAAWRGMEDTHEFFGMLKEFGVSRTQALRLAPSEFVRPVANDATRRMLQTVAKQELPIMVFVGNIGCIQIHTGTIKNLLESGTWYNVMDSNFNLHLREDRIASSWIVQKPTRDGIVSSLEIFDPSGNNIALFFGKRKPGIPEKEEWRKLLDSL